MKSVLSLSLVGASLVSQAVAGDSAAFTLAQAQLAEIKTRTDNLTNSIEMFDTSGNDTIIPVITYSTNNIHYPSVDIVEYVNNATEALKKVPTTLSITESFVIGGPTQQLAYSVNHSIAALNSKVAIFSKFAVGSVVVSDLQNLTDATNAYSDVLLSYVPANIRPVAFALQNQIVNSLAQGLACINSNGTTAAACNTNMVNATETLALALKYGAIRPDGYPIA